MFMKDVKILHIDSNHPLLWEKLESKGFSNEADYSSSKSEIEKKNTPLPRNYYSK